MVTQDQNARPATIERLKEHHGLIAHAIDKQAPVVLGKPNVRVIDYREDERGQPVLIGQYSIGGTREFTREDYLPNGDDGTSVFYQAQVLEQLAREQAAIAAAIRTIQDTQRLLNNPPEPLT